MSDQHREQGTIGGLRLDPLGEGERRWPRRATAWLVAATLLLLIAALGGLAAAYVVAGLRAAPPPDSAFLPTPTATTALTPSPTAGATPTVEPSPSPTPSLAGPTASPSPSPSPFEYTVQRGDSISRIAAEFGVTPEAIIALNELRNPDIIVPGQVLLIPGAPSASPSPE